MAAKTLEHCLPRVHPLIACKCKAARCPTCQRCSRCGCGHDGVAVAVKMTRKRGQRTTTRVASASATGKKRAANKYQAGGLAESPYVPLKKAVQVEAVARKLLTKLGEHPSSNVSAEGQPSGGAFQSPFDILKAFGLGSKVNSLRTHIPSIKTRSMAETWEDFDDPDIQCTFNIFGSVITKNATMFCGNSPEAATCFWQGFLQSREKSTELSRKHDVVMKLASCLVNSKRGSIEKRVARALLSSLISRSEIAFLTDQLPGCTFSRSIFTRARDAYEVLISGKQFVVLPRSVKRFDGSAVDYAIAFLMRQENVSYLSWGTRVLRLDGKAFVFPAILRKRSHKHIFKVYMR